MALLTALLPAIGSAAMAGGPKAASLVVDANTGAVLHSKSADEAVYPASLTKMMTLYMTFELIELGRLDYNSKIKMTEAGAAAAPSKLGLDAGQELSVLDAIKALITKSANDVAIALAQHIGGTEANFARLMTRKAREIGMIRTTFRNASGLPDPEQTTTARDMVTLGLRLQDDFPRHYRLFATRSFSFGGKTYRNHNALLGKYRGTDGIKTGYTRASGFNLVSSVRRDGKHLVAAVFGGDTARERNARMQSLLSSSFAKASTKVTRKPAMVARAPQPVAAKAPVQVVAAPPPLSPASRIVMVPPRSGKEAAADTAAAALATPPPAQKSRPSIAVAKVRPVRLAAPSGEVASAEPAPEPRFAVAGTGDAMPQHGLSTSASLFPRFVPETGALRPSTLQEQAAHLERVSVAPAAPVSATAAPAPPPRVPAHVRSGRGASFDVQIGAFGDSAEAERRMAAARQRAGGLLNDYRAEAVPVTSGGGRLYRARFRGFDSTAANETCSRLRGIKIDCFVARAE